MRTYCDEDKIKLQQNLVLIRRIAGWTAADLGELIGVTKQTISNLENGRTPMTKTQYIAIRSIIDYEISSDPDNTVLAQVMSLLFDSEDLSEEDQMKVDAAVAYAAGAKEKGQKGSAISAGLTALAATLGLACLPAAPAALPLWLCGISAGKKMREKSDTSQ